MTSMRSPYTGDGEKVGSSCKDGESELLGTVRTDPSGRKFFRWANGYRLYWSCDKVVRMVKADSELEFRALSCALLSMARFTSIIRRETIY